MARRKVRNGLADAAVKGALAGMVGGMVMRAVLEAEQRALLPEEQRMEPPPKKIVQKVEEAQGMELSPGQERAAAVGVHMGYSAGWGAVHGMGSAVLGLPTVPHGLLLGALVYYTSMGPSGFLTKMGITSSPMLQPLRKAAIPVGAHIAYGLTTAVVYEALN